jgi:XapX domain-containing protein
VSQDEFRFSILDILEDILYFGDMAFVTSLAVGFGVGGLYALIGVRSPAPPAVALVGLLGMVLGEFVIGRIHS